MQVCNLKTITGEQIKVEQLKASFHGMTRLPLVRQLGLFLGLGVSIALSIYIVQLSAGVSYPTTATLTMHDVVAGSAVQDVAERHPQSKRSGTVVGNHGIDAVASTTTSDPGKQKQVVSWWDKLRHWGVGRQIIGGSIALLVLLGVLRPVMRNLANISSSGQVAAMEESHRAQTEFEQAEAGVTGAAITEKYEKHLESVRAMAGKEPRLVAQVLKQWLNEN